MKHIAFVALAAALAMPASARDWAAACHKLYRLTDLDHAIEPGFFEPANTIRPQHCRVRGVVNRAIQFAVTMPVNICPEDPPEDCLWCESCGPWNGLLMFTAVGGGAGRIGDTWGLLDVDPLVAWREEGIAPTRIIAEQPGPQLWMSHISPDKSVEQKRRFSRPLCPYPQFAKYTGQGDQNDASNFECVTE